MQDSACKLHNELVNKFPRDVLNKKVLGVPSSTVDVKAKRQRARHENLVLVQLGHENIQRLPDLASGRSKVIRLTSRSVFMARNVFRCALGEDSLARTFLLPIKQTGEYFLVKNAIEVYIAMAEGRF